MPAPRPARHCVRLSLSASACLAASLAATGPAVVLAQAPARPPSAAAPAAPAQAAPATAIDARPWPRAYAVDGVQFSLYRPELDSWIGDHLTARAVMAVKTGETKDARGRAVATQDYGVLWISARTETDKAAQEVVLTGITIDRASFPTAKAKEAQYLAAMRKAAPVTELVVSLNQLEAQLALTQAGRSSAASQPVNNTPPDIVFAFRPSELVLIDGQPVFRPAGAAGVERVINTRAVLLRYQGAYYIGHSGQWAKAPALGGPWAAATPPPAVSQAAQALAKAQPDKPLSGQATVKPASTGVPDIVVRTHPSELIVLDGQPVFAPITGTGLTYVSNTPADVFVDGSGTWYVLIAGRWFSGPSTKGPWKWVDPKALPPDFAKIPSTGPKGAVLASLPGTPEAKESLVANSVPQTATVDRAQAHFQAQYDGQPQFKPIPGTSLTYAVNSAAPVIAVGKRYYALQNAVWFTAASPAGPWTVATSVPADIYKIPSASPLHYVTYVTVYGSSGQQVYVGYTPGYYGTVVNDGVVVYGAGYPCDPWMGAVWYGCPTPYGYGAAFGYGAAVGWALAFGWGWADPWYAPWWGPWGYWPGWYYPGGVVAGNVYGRWGNSVVAGTRAAWADPWTGNYGRAGQGGYFNQATGGRGYGYAGRNTNAYTGRSAAQAGGVRYNPQTGRVVAGQGGSVSNIYTGAGVAGGQRTVVNSNTGRVTNQAGVAGRGAAGAGAAGAFNTTGAGGDAAGAGYVRYDRSSGDISKGGVVDVNGAVYAGHDGNVYKHTADGWQEAGAGGQFSKVQKPDPSLAGAQQARDRGVQRDKAAGAGFERPGATRPAFDRSAFGGGFHGRMGGFRGGGRFRR